MNIHATNGIRTHDFSVGADEDSPCILLMIMEIPAYRNE
jgi:hypothetical protein